MLRELLYFLALLPILWFLVRELSVGKVDAIILVLSLFYFLYMGLEEKEERMKGELTEAQRILLEQLPATHTQLKQRFPLSTLNTYLAELNDAGMIFRSRDMVWRLTPKGVASIYRSPFRRLFFQFKAYLDKIFLK